MLRVSMVTRKMKTPEVATPGFSIPFWEGGLLLAVQPFAYVVGDYTCHNREKKC